MFDGSQKVAFARDSESALNSPIAGIATAVAGVQGPKLREKDGTSHGVPRSSSFIFFCEPRRNVRETAGRNSA